MTETLRREGCLWIAWAVHFFAWAAVVSLVGFMFWVIAYRGTP